MSDLRAIVADPDRLAALERYQILDTAPEPGYDDIVTVAKLLCDTPIALVSLVAEDRQWFKARAGFELYETPLDQSICAHALRQRVLLIIPDLTLDERTKTNALVTAGPRIRFYAGAPLETPSGHIIGTICVIDTVPRPAGLTAPQQDGLWALARQVIIVLEMRRAVQQRNDALVRQSALVKLGEALRDCRDSREMPGIAAKVVANTLMAIHAGFGVVGPDGERITVEEKATSAGAAALAGTHGLRDFGTSLEALLRGETVAVDDLEADPRTRGGASAFVHLGIRTVMTVPVLENGRLVGVLFAHDDRPHAWREDECVFIQTVADRLHVAIGRRQAEEQQRLLNQELGHRLKNTLAMVQAIATQTLRAVPDQSAVEAFRKRLIAFSGAHDVLLQESWLAAPIGAVVRGTVALQADLTRFLINGPDLAIGPKAVLSLTLLLHELATNAVKYGALSVEGGSVQLSWSVEHEAQPVLLRLSWQEKDGPPPNATMERGFGSRLIAAGLVGTRVARLRYEPSGLQAVFEAPLAEVTGA